MVESGRIHATIIINKYHERFDLVQMLFGRGGLGFRRINITTGVKVRLRGRNSCNLEVDGKEEAQVPLQVCVSTQRAHEAQLREAANLLVQMLTDIDQIYREFCNEQGLTHENPLFSFGEVSKGCEALFADLILLYPPLTL